MSDEPEVPSSWPIDLKRVVADVEWHYIDLALESSGGNRAEAARLLGIERTTLVEKLRRREKQP